MGEKRNTNDNRTEVQSSIGLDEWRREGGIEKNEERTKTDTYKGATDKRDGMDRQTE